MTETSTYFYAQNHKNCFKDTVTYGLDPKVYDVHMESLGRAQHAIQLDVENQLPYLTLPSSHTDLEALHDVVNQYRQFKNVVIFGTGGSSLGGLSLQQIAEITTSQSDLPKLHIISTIDPFGYTHLFKSLDLTSTGFIVISKSGNTTETIMQILTVIPMLLEHMNEDKLKDCITCISQPGDNALRTLAHRYNIPVLSHDPNLGGRYSVFSLVGILPALFVGLSAVDFRHGANVVLQDALSGDVRDCYPAIGSAIQMGLYQDRHVNTSVLLAYSDRLGSLARWWRQLWAESLGKDGVGTTPVYGQCPVDQHSQLQLWLDGPKDKFFTLINTENDVQTSPIHNPLLSEMGMSYLQGRSLSDLINSSCLATYDTLVENGLPTRIISVKSLDVSSMGALMMHYVLETVFSAYILGVNPFDQPAVEHGKVLTKAYLGNMT